MPSNIEGLEGARNRILQLLSESPSRVLIGIVGKPGAGKSTFTSKLKELLTKENVTVLSQDGYHLSNSQLASLNRADRKGAPDTFDPKGFSELLDRVSKDFTNEIYFPIFHREIEESIAAEGVITPQTKVVLVEGNYLLLDSFGWQEVSKFLHEKWYLLVDDELRLKRLVARHIEFGKSPEFAHAWAHGTDEKNAKLIESTQHRADANLLVYSD